MSVLGRLTEQYTDYFTDMSHVKISQARGCAVELFIHNDEQFMYVNISEDREETEFNNINSATSTLL